MPLPANSEAANIALLSNLLSHPGNQKSLLQKWKESGHKHQLAICFSFPPDTVISLKKGVKQSSSYAERVMRLCETVNQPDTIKADIWTRTLNDGTLAGIQPNQTVVDPITPEKFFQMVGYVLVAYVGPGEGMETPAVSAVYGHYEKMGNVPTAPTEIEWQEDPFVQKSGFIDAKAAAKVKMMQLEAMKKKKSLPIWE